MSLSQVLIHIGYPKTASTWLQQVVFKDQNIGFWPGWGIPSSEAIKQFAIPNSFRFSRESALKVFEPGLQAADKQNLVPVLSHEHLVGNQIRGKYWGKEVADRIHAVFPEARILIFIREQKSIILSSYRQYIKGGGTATIQRFIGTDITKPGFEPICRIDFLEYDLLISYYQQIFGDFNVLVLPFELFKIDQKTVCQKILDFAKAKNCIDINNSHIQPQQPKNVGFKGATLIGQRQINKFIEPPFWGGSQIPQHGILMHKISAAMDRIIPSSIHQSIERHWQQFIVEQVSDYFRKSNQRTSHLIEINLKDWNYDC